MSLLFIDSSVIVRYYTGDPEAKRALEPVISGEAVGYINSVVFSEVLFVLLKLLTGMRAYELKDRPGRVKETIRLLNKQIAFLQRYFTELEVNEEIKEIALGVTERYGLLPNDAIIAATCKHYNIDTIITFDKDFKRVPWLKVIP